MWRGILCTSSQLVLEKFSSSAFFSEVFGKLHSASLCNSCIPLRHFASQLSSFVLLLCSVASLPWVFCFLLSSDQRSALSAAAFFCVWIRGRKDVPIEGRWVLRGEVLVIFPQAHESLNHALFQKASPGKSPSFPSRRPFFSLLSLGNSKTLLDPLFGCSLVRYQLCAVGGQSCVELVLGP